MYARLARGAKNAKIGAGKRKYLPFRAKNQLNGAAASETSYYSAEIPAEKYQLSANLPAGA